MDQQSNRRYRVRVTKDHLGFCSGHFITYEGHRCERLHGHNYRATVEIEGDLDENYYVFDFVALKEHTKEITDRLDHYVLLATRNPLLTLEETADRVRVTYKDREWAFPRGDCVLLPIENTTAEMIATWIGGQLLDKLREANGYTPKALRVEVEETVGQSAAVEWSF